MAVVNFPSLGGGTPGKEFIAQVYMTTAYRTWAQGGGAGYYSVISSGGNSGYAYFNGGAVIGSPLNGVADVTGGSGFTSITLVGVVGDVLSLYKIAGVKSTTSMSTTSALTTYSSTQTGVTLASNKTGFVDAFLVGGGGGGSHGHHGSGGGGGGVVLLTTWPLDPTKTFNVTIGGAGATRSLSNGGNTIFAGAKALGGGYGSTDHNTAGGNGGCGGGGGHHNGNSAGAGKSIQGTGTQALDIPVIFPSGYGNAAALVGFGFDGAQFTGSNTHAGSGGGGAGGAASGQNGGAAYQLSWNGSYYGAGGSGVRHSSNSHGNNGANWGGPGSGAHSQSPDGNNAQTQGTAGTLIVRSYNLS